MSRVRWAILALLLVALAGCARRDKGEGDEAAAPAHPEVAVAEVRRQSFERAIDVPGEWKSGTEVVIQAPFDAIVEALGPRPGDRVRRGQTLGTWRTWESAAALQGAELLAREARDSSAAHEARRALVEAHRGLVRVPIVAPATGAVVRRSAEPGARLTSGAELLALVADSDVVFEARVPADQAGALRRGAGASISDSTAPPRPAHLVSVLPTAGSDQATLVWLRAEGGAGRPRLGQFARARIRTGPPYEALAVPDSAVVEDDLTGRRRIAVVDAGGRLSWVDVTLGAQQGGWREVRGAGLAAGRRVVVQGQWGLPAGTAVRIRP